MRKIIAIGGNPGAGKTTLIRQYMTAGSWETVSPAPLVTSMFNARADLHILGKYEPAEIFAGTDRLSMSVQPSATRFIHETKSNVMFEGDRLFNLSFLRECLSIKDAAVHIIYLAVDPDVLDSRRQSRGTNQSITFLKGRLTKYDNLLTAFNDKIKVFVNNSPKHQREIITYIDNALYN